jgi:hypothetical protein
MAIDNHLFELLEPDEAIELIAHTRDRRLVVTNLGLAVADDERVAWHIPYAALRRIEFDIEHDRPATLVIVPQSTHDEPQVLAVPPENYEVVARAVGAVGLHLTGQHHLGRSAR